MRENEGWPQFSVQRTPKHHEIDILQLSPEVKESLVGKGITRLGQLINFPDESLLSNGLGQPEIKQIRDQLGLLMDLIGDSQEILDSGMIKVKFLPRGLALCAERPQYQFKLPETEGHLTEIDCLVRLGFLTNRFILGKLRMLETPIAKISQLEKIGQGETKIPGLGRRSQEGIRQSLLNFRLFVSQIQDAAPEKRRLVLEVPSFEEIRESSLWTKQELALIDFILQWQGEHPGREGALKKAAREFGVTPQRVNLKVIRIRALINQPAFLEPRLPTEEVIRFFKTWQKRNPGRTGFLKAAREGLNFSRRTIELCLAEHRERTGEVIPVAQSTLNSQEIERLKSLSPSEALKTINKHWEAFRFPEVFIGLAKLVRRAGHTSLRDMREIIDYLEASGFSIKGIPLQLKQRMVFYRFVHVSEAEAIVKAIQVWKEKQKPKILLLSPYPEADEPSVITRSEFVDKAGYLSLYKIMRGLMARKKRSFHARNYRALLRNLIGKKIISVPIFYSSSKSNPNYKIPAGDLKQFEEEILKALEQPPSL